MVASLDLDVAEREVEWNLEANDLPAREFGGLVDVEVSRGNTVQLGIKVLEDFGNPLKKGEIFFLSPRRHIRISEGEHKHKTQTNKQTNKQSLTITASNVLGFPLFSRRGRISAARGSSSWLSSSSLASAFSKWATLSLRSVYSAI